MDQQDGFEWVERGGRRRGEGDVDAQLNIAVGRRKVIYNLRFLSYSYIMIIFIYNTPRVGCDRGFFVDCSSS